MGKAKSGKTVTKKDEKRNPLASKIKNFDELVKEYELFDENLTFNMVLHKMAETLEFYLKIIQQLLQPEEFHSLYEANAFDDTQKSRLMDLYKKMIIVHRGILKAELLNDEKNSIAIIQLSNSEIQKFKPSMIEVIDRMRDSWKTEVKPDVNRKSANYFG